MCDSDEELEVNFDEYTEYPAGYIRGSDGSYIADIERRTPGIENLQILPYDPAPNADEWRALGRSIGNSNNLLRLDVCPDGADEDVDEVSTEILEAFCTGLSRNRSLKLLRIQEFQFTHARLKLEALHPIFSRNRNLTKVDLSNCNLNGLDIQGLANAIRQSGYRSPIKEIGLGDATIGDDSVPAIINVYNACPRLKILDLSNSSIGDVGCTELASMLFRDTKLIFFSLNGNSLGDEGVLALANAIKFNCTLATLGLENCSNITARGWRGVFRTLCDTSSINGTYHSNHTIKKMQGDCYSDDVILTETDCMTLPETCGMNLLEVLQFCLRANSATDKSISARKKIFRFHMSDVFDLSPFLNIDALVLPHVLGWIGKDYAGHGQNDVEPNRKLSAFYRILRNFPNLCGYPYGQNDVEPNRKRSAFYRILQNCILQNSLDLCGYPSRERKLRCRLEQRIKEGQMEIDKLKVENANLKRRADSGEDENAKLKRIIAQLMSENPELKLNNAS